MKPTTVTITGADDRTKPDDMLRLSAEFPFVEWGILISSTKWGQARYPSPDWVRALLGLAEAGGAQLSAHLCGHLADKVRCGRENPPRRFGRTQINGWAPFDRPMTPTKVILQARTERDFQHACADAVNALGVLGQPMIDVLYDPSGGRGRLIESFPAPNVPGVTLGYAGGIDPWNVEKTVIGIQQKLGNTGYWIDMESGVRTNNQLDLAKARAVLETVQGLSQ